MEGSRCGVNLGKSRGTSAIGPVGEARACDAMEYIHTHVVATKPNFNR